jgi:hypothetical protein
MINSSWERIRKGKLCVRTLKAFQVWNRTNLNNIFKSYIGYCDLEDLQFTWLFWKVIKNLFGMIWQLSLSMFFVTFTSIEKLWDLFVKVLHTLHAPRLNLPNKIKDFQDVHIIELIWTNLITYVKYYDHKTLSFHKLMIKDHTLFRVIFNLLLLPNSKIVEVNTIMDFYGIKMHLCMEWIEMKKMICKFLVIYHC